MGEVFGGMIKAPIQEGVMNEKEGESGRAMNVFLDTSAVIKLYHQEVGSDELLAFLNAHAHDLIVTISDITRTEFHSAFLRRVRMQEIPASPVFAVFGLFDHDLTMFNQVSVDAAVKNMATTLLDNIAHQRGLRTLDAFQLAAAVNAATP